MKIRTGPDGVHFFDRATGTNILIDEMSVVPGKWSRAPRQVSVALTNACDLKCPHCYAPKHPAKLNSDRVAEWLKQLDSEGCLGVGFGGGEPTLYRDFVALCRFASRETGLAVTCTTHGHYLEDSLISDLSGHIHFVRVSMDGVHNTYELLRGKSFHALRDRLKAARSLAPLGINFVVNRQTFHDLDEAVTIAIESGASEFLLLPERPTERARGIDEDTRNALRGWVSSFDKNIQLAISESDSAGFPVCDPLVNEKGLRSYAHLDASGFVKYSSFDTLGVRVGANILDAVEELNEMARRIQ